MYEAFSIYQKINNITDSTVDHPEKHPMHRESLKAFATTTDDALTAYFNQPDEAQQMQTAEEHLKSLEIEKQKHATANSNSKAYPAYHHRHHLQKHPLSEHTQSQHHFTIVNPNKCACNPSCCSYETIM